MGDGLRTILARLSEQTGQDLLSVYDRAKAAGKETDSEQEPEPEEIYQKLVDETRESLPTRREKRAFDRIRKQESKRQAKQKEAQRNARNDSRRMQELQRKMDLKFPLDTIPKLCPTHLWKQTKMILSDPTGAACYAFMKSCPHKVGLGLAKKAALATDEHGVDRYSFSGTDRGAHRARSIMALWLLLVGLSCVTGRRRDRWGRLVKGIPQALLILALADPSTGHEPGRATLSGTHRPDPDHEALDGRVGYLRALKNVGALYTRQARWKEGETEPGRGWEDLQPNEIAPETTESGWKVSLNRYWLVTDRFNDPRNAAVRAELWVNWVAGQQPESVDHETQQPQQAPESSSPVLPPGAT